MKKFKVPWIWVALFVGGYALGAEGLPSGQQFLVFMTIFLIAGFKAGVYWGKRKLKRRARRNAPTVKLEKPDPQLVPMFEPVKTASTCDFCQGEEEIRLAGQKIKCPKCKGKAAAAN